jgi:hypothetical protein
VRERPVVPIEVAHHKSPWPFGCSPFEGQIGAFARGLLSETLRPLRTGPITNRQKGKILDTIGSVLPIRTALF